MKKNETTATTKSATTSPATTTQVDPKARLKEIAAERKALREQVKAANAQAAEARKAESKEVTLRWIRNFSERITRLEAKIAKAQELRQGLIVRAQKNGWLQ